VKKTAALFLSLISLPVWAAGASGLRITYDMSGLPLTITRDAAGTYQFDGLPYPGVVLYQPKSGIMYYQHPEDPAWHTVTAPMLADVVSPATVKAGPAWQPWQGQPTLRWDVTVEKTACAPMFASQGVAAQGGLNVADFAEVLTALQWLNGGVSHPCEKAFFPADAAAKVGMPVQFSGPNGPWQLQEVVQAEVEPIEVPAVSTPVDDDTRLNLLLVQFSPNERVNLLKKFGNLPVGQQVEAISKLLMDEAQP
jgi:hypothetical protein